MLLHGPKQFNQHKDATQTKARFSMTMPMKTILPVTTMIIILLVVFVATKQQQLQQQH
jgi:uncharacterized membrane protein YvbJ